MVFKYKSVGNLQEYVVFTTFGFGVPIFLMLLGLLMIDRDYSDIETFIKNGFSKDFHSFFNLEYITGFTYDGICRQA